FPEDEATTILREIQQLRISPVPADLTQAKAARRERNEQVVEKATQVLRLLKDDEKRAAQFHLAIGQLLEARFQMALAGTQEDVDLLYSDVQALNDRDPKSVAAAEGVYYIAKFAHTQAGMHGRNNPEWFSTLSRWAREFADRFPDQQKRSVSLLFGAARSCELQAQLTKDADLSKRLMTEATLCYTSLAEKYPTTEQGQEATASLRRNTLVGQKLTQFSGPTADGGMVTADDFPGKPTLIYFWDSESEEFTKDLLPLLEKLRKQLPAERLRMVGVALDEDESLMNSFMEKHNVPGQQIFFANPEQRSWNSPLIRFWGIARTPSIWLVDSEGKVTSTTVEVEGVVDELKKIVR
ncbi:MAG: redoxin domain-containing protein, partial [Planctomycetota bacterium]